MPTKFHISTGIALTLISQGIAIRIYRQRITDLVTLHNQLVEDHNSLVYQMHYVTHLLNEKGVNLDEFDLIALPSITKQD